MTKKDVARSTSKGRALTAKQEMFCIEYIKHGNASEAYRASYSASKMKPETVNNKAYQLLNKGEIRARVDELRAPVIAGSQITLERVLAEYAKIAFFDPRKLYNPDGTVKLMDELDDDTAGAIAGVDITTQYRDGNPDDYSEAKKVKVFNKTSALDSLAKHLGMFNDLEKQRIEIELKRLELERIKLEMNPPEDKDSGEEYVILRPDEELPNEPIL